MGQMIHTIRHSTTGRPKLAKIFGPEAYAKGGYVVHTWPADRQERFKDYAESFKHWKKLKKHNETLFRSAVRFALFYVSADGTETKRLYASDGYPFHTLHVSHTP